MSTADETMLIPVNGIYEEVVTYNDENGDPVNLTGATAKMAFKTEKKMSASAIFELTETDGLTLGGALGTISIKIVPAYTALLEGLKGFTDILVVLSGETDPESLGVVPWIGRDGVTNP